MICEVYALDSSLARTSKLIRKRGIEGAVLEVDLARVMTTLCTDELAAAARRLVANDAEPADLKQRLEEVHKLLPYVPVGILDTQTRIAERVTQMYAAS
jgi:hypothetical protein